MHSSDWASVLRMFPADQQASLVICTKAGPELAVDILLRTDGDYLVFRGRVCGSTDEGRGFFLPYDCINCIYINRFVKAREVFALYGEEPPEGLQDNDPDKLAQAQTEKPAAAPAAPTPAAIPVPTTGSHPGTAPRPTLPAPATTPAGLPRIGSAPISASAGGLPANVPAAALHPSGGRLSQVPNSTAPGTAAAADLTVTPAGPRNNILERLRAQRQAGAPPRPPQGE